MIKHLALLVGISSMPGCGAQQDLFGHSPKAVSPTPPAQAPAAQNPPAQAPAAPTAPGTPANAVPGSTMTAASLADLPEGISYLSNLPDLIKAAHLAPYYQRGQHGQNLTIAVLDNGFSGVTNSIGTRLPPDTQVLKGAIDQMVDTTHGVKLAEIVYAMATGTTAYSAAVPGPKMLLINTDGYTNLKDAVSQVIAAKADIVLYSQAWQYGGNFDGKGFINAVIDQATSAGILWINAAGNLGQSSFSAPVTIADDNVTVPLPYQGRYVRFTVPRDLTAVNIVLNWNDYQDTITYATSQDLDLILEDKDQHQLANSRLHQSGPTGNKADVNYSAYPREIINTQLNAGTYYLRVEANTHNFTTASELRITIDGDEVRILEPLPTNTIGIPGDNATVLTVGASDADYSGLMPAVGTQPGKPELQVASFVSFTDGEHHFGTSSAAAIATGALAVFEGAYGKVSRTKILELLNSGTLAAPAPAGAPTLQLPIPSKL